MTDLAGADGRACENGVNADDSVRARTRDSRVTIECRPSESFGRISRLGSPNEFLHLDLVRALFVEVVEVAAVPVFESSNLRFLDESMGKTRGRVNERDTHTCGDCIAISAQLTTDFHKGSVLHR